MRALELAAQPCVLLLQLLQLAYLSTCWIGLRAARLRGASAACSARARCFRQVANIEA